MKHEVELESAPTSEATPTHAQQGVESGVICLECGYDLRGLNAKASCPECSTAIAWSLQGKLFRSSSLEYLKKLKTGSDLITRSILAMAASLILIVAGMIFEAAYSSWGPSIDMMLLIEILNYVGPLFYFVSHIVLLAGWIVFTTQEPGTKEDSNLAVIRRRVRWTAIVCTILQVLSDGLSLIPTPPDIAFRLAALISIAWIVFLCIHDWFALDLTSKLANRVPNGRLAMKAKKSRLHVVLLATFGIALCGLGPLIALVIYWNCVNSLRKGVILSIENRMGTA